MSRFALTHPIPRLLLGASLALVPLVTAWNLAVAPSQEIKIGPKLGGVTFEAPVTMSWSSLRDGSFQKARGKPADGSLRFPAAFDPDQQRDPFRTVRRSDRAAARQRQRRDN